MTAPPRRIRSRARKRSTPKRKKPFERSKAPRATSADVRLLPGKERRIGDLGAVRQYWRVFFKGVQAGRAFIVAQKPDRKDPDASITVELNQKSRGRGIGSIAFRKASELSGYPQVYASMRKGNIASQIAATRAGFVPSAEEASNELVLVWRRHK
ncbi:MAG: hypothetical protein QOH88_3174 [Verrucomicrobiota bacterium]|jgi:RimJ/RimL family protein N-acetyltransferase